MNIISASAAAARTVEALEGFTSRYGVPLPTAASDARKAYLDLSRKVRTRQPFDLKAAAAAALDAADPVKEAAKVAKSASADEAERAALSAMLEAAADRARSVATSSSVEAIEAALTGPVLSSAAADLAALVAEGHLPAVVREEDPDSAIVHARARKAEKVVEAFAQHVAALGYGGAIDLPVLVLIDPSPALASHPVSTVHAAANGINGTSTVGAFQAVQGYADPVFRPVAPTGPAAVLLARRGAVVHLADSLDEVYRRHEALTYSAAPASFDGDV